jgi:hypothetical protein
VLPEQHPPAHVVELHTGVADTVAELGPQPYALPADTWYEYMVPVLRPLWTKLVDVVVVISVAPLQTW